MRQVLVGLALLVLAAPAAAAPGDLRSLQGVLEWPTMLGNDRFLVMRADDGGQYVVELGDAQKLSPVSIRAGERMSVAGYEGPRAWQVEAYALAAGNTLPPSAATPAQRAAAPGSVAGSAPSSPPAPTTATPAPVTPAPSPPEGPLERIHGRVVSTSGTKVVLNADNGERYTVDVSRLTAQRRLQPNKEATIFARRIEGQLAAVGVVQVEEEGLSAASPPER
jgi:hypothetical protein